MKLIDLTGQRFGRLTVLELLPKDHKERKYLCECECGATSVVFGNNLKKGHTTSCGCAHLDAKTKHDLFNTKEYWIWHGMRQRCENPNHRAYANYGGRGIAVCDRWQDVRNFVADMGKRPEGYTIDRIDVNGNYTPENCRWATRLQQARNTRRTRYITYDGQTLTLTEWAVIKGLKETTLRERLKRGWDITRALETLPRAP